VIKELALQDKAPVFNGESVFEEDLRTLLKKKISK